MRPVTPSPVHGLTTPPPPRAPTAVRAGFRILDAVSPQLSTRAVEQMWFRLGQPPSPEKRHPATPAGGRAFTTRHDGLVVQGRVYGPDDAPTAHLVHGWAGWWQQLASFVDPLLAAGYRVVAHDAPSHGDSPAGRYGPRSSRVMEIADAYAAVVWQQGPADLVVAHSIGAMSTMWARERGTPAGAYAFVAAAASVEPMLEVFCGSLGLGPRAHARLGHRVARRVGHPLEAFDVAATAARLWGARQDVAARRDGATPTRPAAAAPPLLVVHDRGDRMAPAQGSVDIADAWPEAEVALTEGLGHSRVLRDGEVLSRVVRFAEQHRPARRP